MQICHICKKPIPKIPSMSALYYTKVKYCSRTCAAISISNNFEPARCMTCNKLIPNSIHIPNLKYCSRKCSSHRDLERNGYRSEHPIYNAWKNIKKRCKISDKNKDYKNYGLRGIAVCEEWESDYTTFLKWALINNWKKGLTIERIDNDKGYSPENCKWATRKEQLANRRNTWNITYNGKTLTQLEWSEELGIHHNTLAKRLKVWKDVERAFLTPIDSRYKRTRKINNSKNF